MLWKKRSLEFAAEDVQTLVSKALPALVESLGEPVYISDDEVPALVTQSEVMRQVEGLLANASDTLDTTTIATSLNLSKTSIDAVILQAATRTRSFFDSVHVLPRKRIEAIGNAALAQSQIKRLSDICSEEKITLKAAAYAIRQKSPQLIIVGKEDFVIPAKVLEHHVQRFKSALEATAKPVKYTEIEPDAVLLPLIKHELRIPSHQMEFFPASYLASKKAEAQRLLESAGYIETATVKDFEEPTKFAKQANSILLGHSWIVSQKFLAQQQKDISEELNKKGVVDLRDFPLYPQLTNFIVDEAPNGLTKFRSAKYPSSYLVKPSLERSILSKVNTELEHEAEKKANELEIKATGSSVIEDFVSELELPSLSIVSSIIEKEGGESVPSELKLGEKILPQVRKSYYDTCKRLLKPRLDEAIEKLESKIQCYLNALATLPADTELYSLVWDEWQQYVSEQQFSVPANQDVALQQFKADPSVVTETTDELRNKAAAKLTQLKNRPKDSALILHLACTIYHSEHFCEKPGLLKIRGKAIPKLIKQFQFPPCFNELRQQLKSPSEELLNEVRKSVS